LRINALGENHTLHRTSWLELAVPDSSKKLCCQPLPRESWCPLNRRYRPIALEKPCGCAARPRTTTPCCLIILATSTLPGEINLRPRRCVVSPRSGDPAWQVAPSGTHRQGGSAAAVYRRRHLWSDPALGRHVAFPFERR
jgi:hypothetical protein